MKNKLFVFALGMILLMGIASAEIEDIGIFKKNECVNIFQTCSNCTYINISSVKYPNSSFAEQEVEMTKSGTNYYYNFCKSNFSGEYIVSGYGDIDGQLSTFNFKFRINPYGEEISSSSVWIYIIALLFIVLIMLGLAYLSSRLPSGDKRDDYSGSVIEVSMLKHFRPLIWGFIWALGTSCIFIMSNVALAYTVNPMLGNFFFMLWQIAFYATMIGLPIYFCWIIVNFFQDKRMKKFMERGVEFGGKGL